MFKLKKLIIVLGAIFTAILLSENAYAKTYEKGKASYYSNYFNGRLTANGEIFSNSKIYTAAHKSLPFGTKVKVTNLKNNKSIVVRINDRGPYVKGRVIDLTKAGAKKLDMVKSGVAPVKLEIVYKPTKEESKYKHKVKG